MRKCTIKKSSWDVHTSKNGVDKLRLVRLVALVSKRKHFSSCFKFLIQPVSIKVFELQRCKITKNRNVLSKYLLPYKSCVNCVVVSSVIQKLYSTSCSEFREIHNTHTILAWSPINYSLCYGIALDQVFKNVHICTSISTSLPPEHLWNNVCLCVTLSANLF